MYRLMVTGSRTWDDKEVIVHELQFIAKKYKNVVLVSGHAVGADRLAEEVAIELGWAVEIHEPDWKLNGRSAGYKRNTAMLESGVQAVLAFHKDESTGTADAIRKAKERDVPTRVLIESTPDWVADWAVTV
jgi:YspA, cpYpsA-related SLOG family